MVLAVLAVLFLGAQAFGVGFNAARYNAFCSRLGGPPAGATTSVAPRVAAERPTASAMLPPGTPDPLCPC